jgi:hypothetical protein
MAEVLKGRIRNRSVEPMEGYTVSWSLMQQLSDKLQQAARLVAPVLGSGKELRFEMPLAQGKQGPAYFGPSRLEVRAESGWLAGELDLDSKETARVLQEGQVDIEATALPPGRLSPSDNPLIGRSERISGLVLEVGDGSKVADVQVFVWGRPRPLAGDTDSAAAGAAAVKPLLLLTARSDSAGYFFADRPAAAVAGAWATVAGYNESVAIECDAAGQLPAKLVIGLSVARSAPADEAAKPGCACGVAQSLPQAPDAEQLAASEAYAQDLGGCVDFTLPNRTLDEHSYTMVLRTTDPEIQGLTLPPPPVQTQLGELLDSYEFYGVPLDELGVDDVFSHDGRYGAAGSRAASSRPARRKLPPSVDRALSQIGFASEAAAQAAWSKRSAGRAPLNAANPVDWDNEPTFYQATTIAHGHLLQFKQVFKANGYSRGELVYSLPLAPLQKKQIVVVDWDRRETASRSESMSSEEALTASLQHDRTISDIVDATIEETMRGGSRAHSEARGGAVGAGLAIPIGPVAIPLFGGFAAGGADASSSAWQNSGRDLAMNALNTLSDATSQAASALRRQRATVVQQVSQGETHRIESEVIANNNHCHAMTFQYFQVLRHFIVQTRLADVRECLLVPLLMTRFDDAKALRWREPLLRALRDLRLLRAFDAVDRQINTAFYADFPAERYADEALVQLWGDLGISFQIPRPADDAEGGLVAANWTSYQPLLWDTPEAIFGGLLSGLSAAEREASFKANVAPRLAEAFCDQLRFFAIDQEAGNRTRLQLDATLVDNYREGVALGVSLRVQEALPGSLERARIHAIEIESEVALPAYSKVVVKRGTLRYRSEHFEHVLFDRGSIDNDLKSGSDTVYIACPLATAELRNPREEDEELAARLVAHLNEHLEYYHKAIWLYMDPSRRYMLLDGFVAPHAGGRSVASVCENRIAAIIGNSLVLPVAAGFALDPVFRRVREGRAKPLSLYEHYAPERPLPPLRISMPSRGVFAEAVLGSCNSCEKIDDSRFWKYEEHPSPNEPTPIMPVGSGSLVQPSPNLSPTPFAAPIVAMQSAPPAPDPMGLSAAVQLLGASGLFRDITGLAGNQQNAAAALSGAMSAATQMGLAAAGPVGKALEHAAEAQKQRQANEHADRITQSIDDAVGSGAITPETAGKLKEELLQQRIGAPAPPPPTPREQAVTQAVTQASGGGVPFNYSDGDASLSVGAPPPAAAEAARTASAHSIFEQDPNDPNYISSLAAMIAPVSMVFASDVGRYGAPHKLWVRAERWQTDFMHRHTVAGSESPLGLWRQALIAGAGSTQATSVSYDKEPVFDLIEWLPVEVQGPDFAGGAKVTLPVSARYLIADASVENSTLPEGGERDLHRLPLSIDTGLLFAFGWVIAADGTLRPMTEVEAASHEFGVLAAEYAPEGGATVVGVLELVLGKPDTDYEPSGWLKVARVHPLLSLWSSRDIAHTRVDIRLTRPLLANQTAWGDLVPSGAGEVKASLLSELNGIAEPGSITGPYRWDLRYAAAAADVRGQGAFTVVDAHASEGGTRTRAVWDAAVGDHLTQVYTTRPYQGAFDHLVLAPTWGLQGQPPGRYEAIAAPLTPPGALHMRWRYSDAFTRAEQFGFDGRMDEVWAGQPSQSPGLPMVPQNQSVSLVFDFPFEPTLIYRVDAQFAPGHQWQVFMHHGCGYVTGTTLGIDILPLRGLSGEGSATWSHFHQFNRYTTDSAGQLVPWLDELDLSSM